MRQSYKNREHNTADNKKKSLKKNVQPFVRIK